jgi:nucleoside-diphosphate-sugar epimerase
VKVFVAGATGVLGRSAVARFIEAGHEVTGIARGETKATILRDLGATPALIDLFDPKAVVDGASGHDVVCNFATRIPASSRMVLRSSWRENDRLLTEASRILVDAALAAGSRIYVQQTAGFMYADGRDRWLDEDAPTDPPPHGLCMFEAERQAARFAEFDGIGIALRLALFYGPSAGTTRDQLRIARLGISPFPGRRDSYYPSIHTEDLGTAAVAALAAPTGIYNVTDDDPLTRADLARALAAAIDRRRLRIARMPLKRFDYIARSQRVSNKRFKEATGWAPKYPSAREGWPEVIAALRG